MKELINPVNKTFEDDIFVFQVLEIGLAYLIFYMFLFFYHV